MAISPPLSCDCGATPTAGPQRPIGVPLEALMDIPNAPAVYIVTTFTDKRDRHHAIIVRHKCQGIATHGGVRDETRIRIVKWARALSEHYGVPIDTSQADPAVEKLFARP